MARCSMSGSATWAPMRCSGFSALIGSWKIMAMRSPRSFRISISPSRGEIAALEPDGAGDDGAVGQ